VQAGTAVVSFFVSKESDAAGLPQEPELPQHEAKANDTPKNKPE
jgi:hypothetical protein